MSTASSAPAPGGADFDLVAEVQVDPVGGLVHEHGWQSWSETGTYPVHLISERPADRREQLMQFRPDAPAPPEGFQGEGILAVQAAPGAPISVYGAADPIQRVPSIRARLAGDRLIITADGPVTVREHDGGFQAALASFGDEVVATLGIPAPRPAPSVWCSWYHYFLDVTQDDILENLDAIGTADLPVDVVQIDDGWQLGVGDWTELSPRFSSLGDLAARIRDTGRRAGIWIAPFLTTAASRLARDHPDWLVGPAGHNWGSPLLGIDLTRPDVRAWLTDVLHGLRADGFDYFKLDFVYAGAIPGARHDDVTGIEAYRSGLELIREAVGPDAFLLGCGAPILPSVGLVDGMRVSPDTYLPDDPTDTDDAPLRGRRCSESRRWQHGRFWVNDADCLVARPAFVRREAWSEVVERCSGLRSASDRVADLDAWGLDTTRRLLGSVPPPTPFRELLDPARSA